MPCKSKITSMNLYRYFKIHWNTLHFERLLYHPWICNIIHWSFKYWLTEFIQIFLTLIHHVIQQPEKNLHSFISPLRSPEKSLSTSEQSLSRWYASFPKLTFTWKLGFYHWQKILPNVFLEVTGSLLLVKRKYLPNTQVWKIKKTVS